jgi:hypothetical protein
MVSWLESNWFNAIQTIALIATLSLAISVSRSSRQATRMSNMIAIMINRRETWGKLQTNPKLKNVLRDEPLKENEQVTPEEYSFVVDIVNQFLMVYEVSKWDGMPLDQQTHEREIRDIMSRPVFQAAWRVNKGYRKPDFVKFMDRCISGQNYRLEAETD